MWCNDSILEAMVDTLREREAQLADEQAVYGLDALPEIELHALLMSGLMARGFAPLREQAYPEEWKRRKADRHSPLPRDRQRCDIVLLPTGRKKLRDEVRVVKRAKAIADMGAGSLFGALASADAEQSLSARDTHEAEPEDAHWLEFKLVSQYCYSNGVPGPNATYSSELTRSLIKDLGKLVKDRRIRSAAAALIMFSADEKTAEHDLSVVMHKALDRDLPVASPLRKSFPVQDRIGNRVCTVMVAPTRATAHETGED